VEVKTRFEPEKVFTVNLIEDEKEELNMRNGKLELEFKPFEIKSLKMYF
jgi:hypothetical protein